MKLFAVIQVIVSVVGYLVLLTWRDNNAAASFAAGSGIVFFNVFSMGLTWFYVIRKKLIALTLTIIVFKYPILGIIIYKLLSLDWINQIWFSVGLASLIVTTLFYAAARPQARGSEEGSNE